MSKPARLVRLWLLVAAVLLASLVGTAANATRYGFVDGNSGNSPEIIITATDGFTTERPIRTTVQNAVGGFLQTRTDGILQPVLLIDEIGFSWRDISLTGTLGAAQTPVQLVIDILDVSFSEPGSRLNQTAFTAGSSGQIRGSLQRGRAQGRLDPARKSGLNGGS